MPATVKMKSKGTSVLQSISAVYTAIPDLISIDKGEEGTETFDSTTLDGLSGKTKAPTGYAEPPEFTIEYFYDATHASHAKLKTDARTPANLPCNFKLTYTDAGPVSEVWAVAGIKVSEKFAANDGVKATAKLTTSGMVS